MFLMNEKQYRPKYFTIYNALYYLVTYLFIKLLFDCYMPQIEEIILHFFVHRQRQRNV